MEKSFNRGLFLTASALTLLVAFSGPARAADPMITGPGWTGFYIGANGGGGAVVNEIEVPALGGLDVNGIGGEGALGSIMAGYNHQMNNIVLGLQGEVGYDDLHTNVDVPGIGFTLDAQQGLVASLSARAGLLVTPETLAYIIGGYSYSEYKTKLTGLGTFKQNYDGFHVGGGLEAMISPNATVRVEYRYTSYGSEVWGSGGLVDVSPSTHTGTVGVAWNF